MTSIKDKKLLVAIAGIAAILAGSTIAIGNGRAALADETITKRIDNTGINLQTHTNQKQQCDTAGGNSPIGVITGGSQSQGAGAAKVSPSCTAGSLDSVSQSGGDLNK